VKFAELILVKFPRFLIGVMMLAMVAINFANVIGRKFFNSAIFWSEEVMLFMLIWSVFLAAIAITYDNKHLRMDLFSARLKAPWSYFLNFLMVGLFVAAAGFMLMQSEKVVSMMASTGQVSNAAKIPMVVLHLAVLVGFTGMIVAVLVRLRSYIKGGD